MRVNRCPTRISKVQQRIERRLLRQARMLARLMTIRPMAKQLGCSKSTAGRGALLIRTAWAEHRLGGLERDVPELRDMPVTLWGAQGPRMTKRLQRVLELRRRALGPLTLREIMG